MASLPQLRRRLEQCADPAEQRHHSDADPRDERRAQDRRRTTTIRVLDFGSQYLPLPYAPRSFDVAGDWRYDANSLVVVNANNRTQDLRRLTYTVESVDIAPDGPALASALAGTPADDAVTGEIPSDLPDSLTNLAQKVTANADTAGRRRLPRSRPICGAASSLTAPNASPGAAIRRWRTSCSSITRATASSSRQRWR